MQDIYSRGIIGVALALLSYLFGAYDSLMMALVAVMSIEIIAYIIKLAKQKEICSSKFFDVGAKKIGVLSIIALANIIDGILELSGILRNVAISYFIANEGISLIEDWGAMGLPVPNKIKEFLLQLKSIK